MSVDRVEYVPIDRENARRRITRDIEELGGAAFTTSRCATRRYAYTPEYRRTLDWFGDRFGELGFSVSEDPLGTFMAQNRPVGTPVFGLGSHCDSNRNGGRWDGTLGVVMALEVSRLAADAGLAIPLRAIAFVEEEGSGFGQLLLGSRACMGKLTETDLRTNFCAIDDGRPFWSHAVEAGYAPERLSECRAVLDDLMGWIECHIEQGRVLQDAGDTLGLVDGIAGCVHADIEIEGRADHAGATPMSQRVDAMAAAAEVTLELERRACEAGNGTVAGVGELTLSPGAINVIPGHARLGVDIRGIEAESYRGVARAIETFAESRMRLRGGTATYRERQDSPPVRLDDGVVRTLGSATRVSGAPYRRMVSGATHDTAVIAERVPSAMVFVPCRDGISHSPDESADPTNAAVACEVVLNAARWISDDAHQLAGTGEQARG
jgi:hydantoinase/carbamoylase family amidase